MALSDDARQAISRWNNRPKRECGCLCPGSHTHGGGGGGCHCCTMGVLMVVLPDGRTLAEALDQGEEWRRWGRDLAQPALRAIMTGDGADRDAAFAAIKRWDDDQ